VADRDPRDVERIAELEAQVARIPELERRVAELGELVMSLKRQLDQNSRNSHLPPSSDGPGARPPAEKKPGGVPRKRGGQPGHPGHKRDLLSADQVDEVVELYPKQCESCWAPLPEVRDQDATRYQMTEMPPVRPHTTEYRCNGVTCGCGHTTYAETAGIVPMSPFGPRLMALIALLTGVYHLSRRKAATLLHDVLGVRLSLGALSTVEGRVSTAVEWPVVRYGPSPPRQSPSSKFWLMAPPTRWRPFSALARAFS
jgi:transposase